MIYSIIELHTYDKSKFLILWGQDEDSDYFMLDKDQNICGFLSIENLKQYIGKGNKKISPFNPNELLKNKKLLFDQRNIFKFHEINDILINNPSIKDMEPQNINLLLEVYNLISDFFYKIKDEDILELRENKNIKMFFDFCYYKYFWKQGEELIVLEKEMQNFDYKEFCDLYKIMTCRFINRIMGY